MSDVPESAAVPRHAETQAGLEPKVGALLSYLLFGWIGGLIMFFTQKHPEVRFHAAQSIITFGGLSVLQLLLNSFVIGLGSFVLIGLLSTLVGIASFVLWILLSIKGYNLEHFKLPVVGDYAERWAAAQQT
jgi:uncharacterized membrane protein